MRILLPVIVLILLFCISLNMLLAVGLNTEDNVFAQVVQENIKLRRQLYLANRYVWHVTIVNKELNKRLERRYMLIDGVEI